jgi:hypothetical protein
LTTIAATLWTPAAATASPVLAPAAARAPVQSKPLVGAALESDDRRCGGRLEFGQVAVCGSIAGDDVDRFRIVSKVDNDTLFTLLTRSSGDWVSGSVIDNAGNSVCFVTVDSGTCQLGRKGTYTLTLSLLFATGTGNYSISVESMRTPSSCRTLTSSFFSFASPGITGTLPFGLAARCFVFDQPQDALLYLEQPGTGGADVQSPIFDRQYQQLCTVRYATTCRLTGPGPYRIFLHEYYGAQATYLLRMPRISASTGCAIMRPGAFGDQGSAVGSGTVSTHVTCNKIRASAAGLVAIRFSPDQSLFWTVYDNAGQAVCDRFSNFSSCALPASGDYTVLVLSQDLFGSSISYKVGVTALNGTAGCAPTTATNWDRPALLVHQTSPVQVNCQPFQGASGDRIVTYAAPTVFNDVIQSLVDTTGAVVCPGFSDQDGCVLPAAGTYRVVSYLLNWDDQVSDATYQLQIHRLSSPQGCPTLTPGAYNAAPAGALGGIRCRILDLPGAATYLLKAVDAQNYETFGQVYDSAGLKVCTSGQCSVPAAGRYTMVLNGSARNSVIDVDFQYAVALLPSVPSGCPQVSDDRSQLVPYHGQFAGAGEYGCVQLTSPAGAKVMELVPGDSTGAGRPPVTVVDATGTYVCDSSFALRQQACELTGTAPFFAVFTPSGGFAAGAYTMFYPRVDGAADCTSLTRDGTTLTTSADVFTACYTIPADQHAAHETVTYRRVSGSGDAEVAIFDGTGIRWCGSLSFPSTNRTVTCSLPAGPATVLFEGDAVDASYELTHAAAP